LQAAAYNAFFHRFVQLAIKGSYILMFSYRKVHLSLATFCRPNSLSGFSSALRAHSITGGIMMNWRQLCWCKHHYHGCQKCEMCSYV